MTYKEAIKFFNDFLNLMYKNREKQILNNDYCNASRKAIEAMEKQMPMKVKYINRHGDGSDLYNKDYFSCPSCGRRLRNKKHDNYCGRCGQALDWSDYK